VWALAGAEIEMLAGEPREAERELRRAYETLEAMGESGVRAVVAAMLASALCAQGRDEESWELVRLTEKIADPADVFPQVLERTTRARLLVRANEPERAEEVAREALALAATTDCVSLHADGRVALATALAHSGRHDEARELLEEARAIHEAKGNVVAATRLAESLVTEPQPL
jgi:tetratricopeptide (TPR) repeat protein